MVFHWMMWCLSTRELVATSMLAELFKCVYAEQSADLPTDEQETRLCLEAVSVLPSSNSAGNMQPAIVVRDLKKMYQRGTIRIPVLRGISFQVQRGEFVAITGASGAGKTTLLHVLGCLAQPSHGDYWLAGKMMNRMTADELALIRNQHIGFVFQEPGLLKRMSALKNVALPLLYAGFSQAEQERRAGNALQFVGLGSRLQHKPAQLSPGQQQRVALARALINSPFLLLADEPTGNLGTRSSLEMMAVLQALNQRGLTIVLVTHEPDIVLYTKRQIVLNDGRIVHDGPIPERRLAINDLSQNRGALPENGDGGECARVQEELP